MDHHEKQELKKIKHILEKHTPRVQEEQLGDKPTLRLEHQSTLQAVTPKSKIKDGTHGFNATISCITHVNENNSKENASDHPGYSKEYLNFINFEQKKTNSNNGTYVTSKISTMNRNSQHNSQEDLVNTLKKQQEEKQDTVRRDDTVVHGDISPRNGRNPEMRK